MLVDSEMTDKVISEWREAALTAEAELKQLKETYDRDEKARCCSLRKAIERLIREKPCISGIVLSDNPDGYVMVKDLRVVLKATAKAEEEKLEKCPCGYTANHDYSYHTKPECPYYAT